MKYGYLKGLAVGLFAVTMFSSMASAEYVRFWRGEMRSDISRVDFLDGLNHGLFPATAELAKTESKLLSYQPVLASNEALEHRIPTEVALLQYENENSYRTYRQTPEGIHYGNMHWNYFQKDLSKSLVVEEWSGSVEIEKAYFVGKMGTVWNEGITNYRVYVRNPGLTDEHYLQSVNKSLGTFKDSRNSNVVLLVAREYVLQYTQQSSEEQPGSFLELNLVQSTLLSRSKIVSEQVLGLTYPVKELTEDSGVRSTWMRHIAAWKERNLQSILSDYDQDSVVILNDEIYRGHDQIAKLFSKLFNAFDHATQSKIYRIVIERSAVYLLWDVIVAMDTEKTFSGTDTFFIQNGRIKVQTITVDPAFFGS